MFKAESDGGNLGQSIYFMDKGPEVSMGYITVWGHTS